MRPRCFLVEASSTRNGSTTRKEQALRIADARKLAAFPARRGAQLFEDGRSAGRRFAAQHRTLELGRQQRTRFRRQLKQILTQFLAGQRVRHAPPETRFTEG